MIKISYSHSKEFPKFFLRTQIKIKERSTTAQTNIPDPKSIDKEKNKPYRNSQVIKDATIYPKTEKLIGSQRY